MAEPLVKRFQCLQEQRTQTFNQLDTAHRVFLASAPKYEEAFDDFKKEVSQATDKFKKISEEIIEIKKSLEAEHRHTPLAGLVARVQVLEEKKLNRVVDLQLASQQALDNPGDNLCEKNARLIKLDLLKVCGEITEVLTEIRYEVVDLDPPA